MAVVDSGRRVWSLFENFVDPNRRVHPVCENLASCEQVKTGLIGQGLVCGEPDSTSRDPGKVDLNRGESHFFSVKFSRRDQTVDRASPTESEQGGTLWGELVDRPHRCLTSHRCWS